MSTTAEEMAAAQAVEDKIGAKFGFPAATQETHEESADEALAEIEWEGERYQVPSKLKGAFLQNADYTQKTQTLAERTRQMDHMREIAEQGMADRAFALQPSDLTRRHSPELEALSGGVDQR